MSKRRQDSWTSDEDQLLTETVLQYIRDGKTQLEAFKVVGEKLSRTAAACGFRWNKTLRHQYAESIELAKKRFKERQQSHQEKNFELNEHNESPNSIEKAISVLLEYKEQKEQQPMLQSLQEKLGQLEEENRHLKALLNRYDEAWREINNIWHWTKKDESLNEFILNDEKTD
mgnify:FL=1